ncbi:MAG: AAA family ATPase [Treponema sp.]|jgi:putative ATPase|nr:AAA family ATPase [Treponema sp.]
MDDIFQAGAAPQAEGPLADRMRPRTLDEVIGQDHIVGPGRLLRRAIQADRLSSVIFYGPPGTGKTSLARVIANTTRSTFASLNAVLTGIKDIREVIDHADERRRLYGSRTILFVDEVHRWNKAQQDALLPWVENGTVILVGATTENPFFEVNRALVSRSRIFQLKPLEPRDLRLAAERCLADRERGYGKWRVVFAEGALEHLVEVAGGDARSLLNALELAVETSPWDLGGSLPPRPSPLRGLGLPPSAGDTPATPPSITPGSKTPLPTPHSPLPTPHTWPPPEGVEIFVSMEAAEESIQRRAVLYDRDGDYHFDTISAFIKSVRGSDPDAALYWLAKMVAAGEDPAFLFRRMIILASEDVGLADPHALEVVIACAQAFDRIGFPEGNFPLAHACLYLASAPKSNSCMAFFDALKEVEKEDAEVPNHLRDASRDAEGFGHGAGYIYPHAFREHWAAQQYLPSALRGMTFYLPGRLGYEGTIRAEVLRKREIQAAAVLGEGAGASPLEAAADGEALSWSAAAPGREHWFKRLESGRSGLLIADRDAILSRAPLARQDRVLLPRSDDGLLLWEALRRVPEGLAAALVTNETAKEALLRYAATLDEDEQPRVAVLAGGDLLPEPAEAERLFDCGVFDCVMAREPWRRRGSQAEFAAFAERAARLLAPGGRVSLLQSAPRMGERISRVLASCGDSPLEGDLLEALAAAEEAFFAHDERLNWEPAALEGAFTEAGFVTRMTVIAQKEYRLLTRGDLARWFDAEQSAWGAFVRERLGEAAFDAVRRALEERAAQGPVEWRWQALGVAAGLPPA